MSTGTIELRLTHVQQVFNSLDPTPFPERDLDDDAVEFVTGWAEDFPGDATLALVVHLPEAERGHAAEARMAEAIAEYFAYRRDNELRRLRRLFRVGRLSALIGIVFLAACNLAGEAIAAASDDPLSGLLQEGLAIFGWVANWRPAEIFLYEWWPLRRRARLYDRLSRMPVELRFDALRPAP